MVVALAFSPDGKLLGTAGGAPTVDGEIKIFEVGSWKLVTDIKNDKGQSYRGVRQQFVKLGATRGDQVAVVSGIKPGDEVVTSGVFKLRNRAAVVVNNKVRPGNNPKPRPENS